MQDTQPPAELGHAGAVIEKAVEYMMEKQIGSLAIASALLGSALMLMARSMSEPAILGVLENAAATVRAGQLRAMAVPGDDDAPSRSGY